MILQHLILTNPYEGITEEQTNQSLMDRKDLLVFE